VFGDDVTANTYAPASVDQQVAQLARVAAHRAVALPDDVADMSDFEKPHTTPGALSQPLYVDFGSGLSAMPWNNVTTHDNSGTKFWLKTPEGVYTDVAIEVAGGFTGVYPGVGGETSHEAFTVSGTEFPVSAWKDALIVSGTKGGGDVGPGVLTVSGLDPAAEYDFTILAVRYNGSRSARMSTYRIVGRSESETKEVYTGLKIGSSGNEVFPSFDVVPFGEFVAEFAAIAPDGNGTVAVEVRGVDTGVAADGHISALVIRERR
ncbi:MAG: DUF4886 domain-containing protein, partial [Muribaculaceae bacterium]|nr:DUF4886 domain-containing protein [Muribaculaceae bacterium]